MKRFILILIPALILASCGNKPDKATELANLKKQRAEIDLKIKVLEAGKQDSVKLTPVSVVELQPTDFHAFIEVQSQITSDENVLATPKAMGTVKSISVKPGQRVTQGELLATLDASTVEQQIETLTPQYNLQKSIYEKQQSLWSQNIGTEVQLMTAKAQYEATQKQIAALQNQRDLYRIVSPITGTVDAVNLKVGDFATPGMTGIRVVSLEKLKAEGSLGENYLGKVKEGDEVTLLLPDINDSIKSHLNYVAKAVDILSRAFTVQIQLGVNGKLHPNMSCIMRISNYENPHALVVPVSVIQKTSNGEMLYIVDGNKSKSVLVKTGRNSNGKVEILSGLKAGDKVITAGYEEMDEGQAISIQ